MVETVRHS